MVTGIENGTGKEIGIGKGEKIGLDEMKKGTEERRRRMLKGQLFKDKIYCFHLKYLNLSQVVF